MYKIKSILGLAGLLVAATANAGDSTGIVTSLYVHSPNATYSAAPQGVVMFAAGNPTGTASCSRYGEWAIRLDTPLGKMMHSTLLTAIASGKTVTVQGDGTCGDWSDRERPYYIRINN